MKFPLVGLFVAAAVLAPAFAQDQEKDQPAVPPFAVDPFWPKPLPNNWILGQVAADVVADYFAYYAHGSTSAVDDMLHRMRADLHATASKIPLLQ